LDNSTNGTPRTATYQFLAPGGSFDPADDGTYTVTLQSNQVFDVTGLPVPDGIQGFFQVVLPWSFVVTNALDGPVANAGDLPGSFRQAIFDANAAGTAATIVFDPAD